MNLPKNNKLLKGLFFLLIPIAFGVVAAKYFFPTNGKKINQTEQKKKFYEQSSQNKKLDQVLDELDEVKEKLKVLDEVKKELEEMKSILEKAESEKKTIQEEKKKLK